MAAPDNRPGRPEGFGRFLRTQFRAMVQAAIID
jgi:hypothetical protein